MSATLINVLALLVTLGILITVHEWGHFFVARRLGVKVLRFSIGFGQPLWRRTDAQGTEYVLAAIPLGGYVQMLDEREGDVPAEERHRAFNTQPVGTRIAVVAAGPLCNFLFAIGAYALVFMVGVTAALPLLGEPTPESPAARAGFEMGETIVAVNGQATPTLDRVVLALIDASLAATGRTDDATVLATITVENEQGTRRERQLDLSGANTHAEKGQVLRFLGLRPWPLPAVVGQVQTDSPAARAGLQTNDRIVAVDNRPVSGWEDLVAVIRERPEVAVTLAVRRDTTTLDVIVTPIAVQDGGETIGRIGIGPSPQGGGDDKLFTTIQHDPLSALWQGTVKTWEMSWFTLKMFGRMLFGQASLENLSGPLTIAQVAGQAATVGVTAFLSLLALISISLAVLNLLPVPVLDGGHLLFYFIEIVKGSPLSEDWQLVGQKIGIALVLMLMSVAIFNDVVRLFS